MEDAISNQIKHADVLPDGLYLIFADGREALLNNDDVIRCAESTNSFEQAAQARAAAAADAAAEESEQP